MKPLYNDPEKMPSMGQNLPKTGSITQDGFKNSSKLSPFSPQPAVSPFSCSNVDGCIT
jgi:hypothetical protein